MLEEFCHYGAQKVIVNGKMQRMRSRDMCQILELRHTLLFKLEATSNQIEFIMKKCHDLMIILNNEQIDDTMKHKIYSWRSINILWTFMYY